MVVVDEPLDSESESKSEGKSGDDPITGTGMQCLVQVCVKSIQLCTTTIITECCLDGITFV